MDVHIEREDRIIQSNAKTVKELLKELNLNPTIVLVSKNDELIIEETKLNDKDIIKIFPVISGG